MTATFHWDAPVRVVVDPNNADPARPDLSIVLLERFASAPSVGDEVFAVQPDKDGLEEAVAPGVIVEVDSSFALVFVRVDWEKLTTLPAPMTKPASFGMWHVDFRGPAFKQTPSRGWASLAVTTEPAPWEPSVELTPA